MSELHLIIAALVFFIVLDVVVIGWLLKSGRIKLRPPGPAGKIVMQRSGSDTLARSDDDPKFHAASATTTGELDELQAFNRKHGV